MSQTPPNPADSAPTADPLRGLYRMSKTAGLASSDYRAVNLPSVFSLLLGLASVLASFEITLIVFAVVGLIVGVMAVYQIRTSNGTQTGMPFAVVGIILSLSLGTWAATGRYREFARTRADREQLVATIERLGTLVKDGKYDQAYLLFSPVFRERVSATEFEEIWSRLNRSPLGKIEGLSSNGLFTFEVDSNTQARLAAGQIIMRYTKDTPPDRPDIYFQLRSGVWTIEQISFFPTKLPGTAPGRS